VLLLVEPEGSIADLGAAEGVVALPGTAEAVLANEDLLELEDPVGRHIGHELLLVGVGVLVAVDRLKTFLEQLQFLLKLLVRTLTT